MSFPVLLGIADRTRPAAAAIGLRHLALDTAGAVIVRDDLTVGARVSPVARTMALGLVTTVAFKEYIA